MSQNLQTSSTADILLTISHPSPLWTEDSSKMHSGQAVILLSAEQFFSFQRQYGP